MTRRLYCLGLLLAFGFCLGAGKPLPAADEAKKTADEPAKVDQAGDDVINIGLAYSLAEYGRKTKSADSLVAAARILRKIRATPIADKPTDEGPKGEKPEKPEAAEVSLLAESNKLLDEARKLAPDDKLIAELADRASKEKTRAALGGPRSYGGAIRAGHTQTLSVSFRIGELATVSVAGNGVSVLHVKVINDAGVIVRENSGRSVNLQWVPEKTRMFRVVITCEGPGPTSYQFFTN